MSSSFSCNKCSLTFSLKKNHSSHQKKCTGGNGDGKVTFFFKETDQTITLERNVKGLYDCYCSHPDCPKTGYVSVEGVKKHMRRANSHWIGINKTKINKNAEVSK